MYKIKTRQNNFLSVILKIEYFASYDSLSAWNSLS